MCQAPVILNPLAPASLIQLPGWLGTLIRLLIGFDDDPGRQVYSASQSLDD